MIENNELFVSRVTSTTCYRITIEDFFDNVLSGDFRINDSSHVQCGDFSTFFFLNAKLRNTKIPRMRFAKLGF